jgi:hypothetical protein
MSNIMLVVSTCMKVFAFVFFSNSELEFYSVDIFGSIFL